VGGDDRKLEYPANWHRKQNRQGRMFMAEKPRKVDDLGRITIPSHLRALLGLIPGARFVSRAEGRRLIVEPVVEFCEVCGAPKVSDDE
jgi:AbrB family looped-hinge helix DNA binding protein